MSCLYYADLVHIVDVSGGSDLPGYFARDDERGTHTHLVVKDSDTIGASYDRYLRVAVCLYTVLIVQL